MMGMSSSEEPSLDRMFDEAAKKLGSHKATLKALGVSRQRVYSAIHGGPPLRVARLLQLGLLANVEPVTTLRAGGQDDVAALLDRALSPRDADITPAERCLLRAVRELPPPLRAAVVTHVNSLALLFDRSEGPFVLLP
jgi:hypothetical protein